MAATKKAKAIAPPPEAVPDRNASREKLEAWLVHHGRYDENGNPDGNATATVDRLYARQVRRGTAQARWNERVARRLMVEPHRRSTGPVDEVVRDLLYLHQMGVGRGSDRRSRIDGGR